jgi:hypothetical protein
MMTVAILYYGSYLQLAKNKFAFSFLINGQVLRFALYVLLII